MSPKNNLNMEEIMHMNDVLKPFQERSNEQSEKNINSQCLNIEVNNNNYIRKQ